MKVSYDFTKDDVWNYGKHVTFSMPSFKRRFILNIITVPVAVCAIGYAMNFRLFGYFAYGIGLTAAYIFVLISVLKIKVIKMNSVKGGPLGSHTLELGLNGIKEKLPEGELNHAWNDIKKIEEDKKNIYIFWGDRAAHVVPKRAFTKAEDVKFFIDTAKSHLENCKNKDKDK